MTDTPEQRPDERAGTASGHGPRRLDETAPNSARLYDYYLGGAHNFEVDRKLAERIIAAAPMTREGARINRRFLQRAVRYLLDEGVDQFLDLGSGVPTAGNVHEIAQLTDPLARVVYVDYEPVAYHAAHKLLADNPNAAIVHADLREVDLVLGHQQTRALLDFTRPVGLLLVGVLLFLPDEDRIGELISRYLAALPTGSYLVISHPSLDEAPQDVRTDVTRIQAGYQHATEQMHMRSRAEIAYWFTGTTLVDPGLVPYVDWRPDEAVTPEQRRASNGYVGVGRIP